MNRTPATMFRTAALVSFVALLAACGGGGDPAPPGPVAGEADAAANDDAGLPWVLDPTLLSDAALVVTPRDCSAEPYAAEVRWSLRPSHGSQPQIWLRSGDGEPKLWVAPSQREGAKDTGAWLTSASSIYLVDGTRELVIARTRLAEVACGG